MAMIKITPLPVDVRCDLFDGRPRSVRVAGERLPVLAVSRVREEAAAYPRTTGPRTVFEVDTSLARLALSFGHRSRRWSVDGIDSYAASGGTPG